MKLVVDPRRGDIEDDASSTKRKSLLSLAGGLLAEISLAKLVVAWGLLLVLPGLLLGLAPIVASDWVRALSEAIVAFTIGIWSLFLLAILITFGWFGWRTLFRLAENNFWSLNSIVVQPSYATCREVIRHVAEGLFAGDANKERRAKLRAAAAAVAGLVICGLALLVVWLVWPSAHLFGSIAEIGNWRRVIIVALANSVVLVAGYLAVAALIWGMADAIMPQPRDVESFASLPEGGRTWRIAHLSDIHVVGERYGFRIESGRSGARGNERLKRLLAQLRELHAEAPLDAILITGDMTDAGSAAEWAECLEAIASYPELAERVLMLPGNHDLNIVDRANPARMDLPTSPNRRLRQIRALSAMVGLQGRQVRVVDHEGGSLGATLEEAVRPHFGEMARFADIARPLLSYALAELWAKSFPMVQPPAREDGLGIVILNSNAETHFSFTNALGMVSAEQVRRMQMALRQFPRACWIIALHHHVVEYPRRAKALSERIGTALINGNWFVRQLRPLAGRAVLMHGHRHIDWIGECAGLTIVSAPSPVMEATDEEPTSFYIHTLAIGLDGGLKLLAPQRIVVPGTPDQNDPNTEPSTITATSATMAPTMPTMTISR